MALPIKETPVLRGADAVRFIEAMHEAETRPITEQERSEYLRAKKTYEGIMARLKERDEVPDEFLAS